MEQSLVYERSPDPEKGHVNPISELNEEVTQDHVETVDGTTVHAVIGASNDNHNGRTSLHLKSNKWIQWIQDISLPEKVYNVAVAVLVAFMAWLAVYTVTGSENLPGGTVFVIFVLEFGGVLAGFLMNLCRLPPMVGMLGLGLLVRNLPYLEFIKYLPSHVSSPIRQISLAVILTRAGLGLNLNALIKYKWLIARFALTPTLLEAASVGILVHLLIGFPWLWSFLVGFVIAAVSPAVIVPRILTLEAEGFGVQKGIPTIILASASLDNIVVIAIFGVLVGSAFSTQSLTAAILQGPLEIAIGIGTGCLYGFITGVIFPRRSSNQAANPGETICKILVILGGSVSFVLGFNHLGYSGAGVISCLLSAFTCTCIWRRREVIHDFQLVQWTFNIIWKMLEPLLFGAIGCQIVFDKLDKGVLFLGGICIAGGALVRFLTTFFVVCGAGLNIKERVFFSIAWVPKATVQAAIGPMALDLVQKSGKVEYEDLALQVLTMAVLVILMSAPLGELGVILSGKRLLSSTST